MTPENGPVSRPTPRETWKAWAAATGSLSILVGAVLLISEADVLRSAAILEARGDVTTAGVIDRTYRSRGPDEYTVIFRAADGRLVTAEVRELSSAEAVRLAENPIGPLRVRYDPQETSRVFSAEASTSVGGRLWSLGKIGLGVAAVMGAAFLLALRPWNPRPDRRTTTPSRSTVVPPRVKRADRQGKRRKR